MATHRPRRHGDMIVLAPLLVASAVLMRVGLYGAPQRIDDEGTYVAQAWAVFHLGELTHYTYWYDHPPLGWLQLALWAQLTGSFDRSPDAVAAGRDFMLVLTLVSAALLWVLAKRLALPRWGAALALVLFVASPLAVQFHRSVYLDNVATPWLLAAFVLALSPRRRLSAFAGAAVCLAVAVLSKETSLLALPVLAWLLWHRSNGGGTRRYAVAVAVSLFGVLGLFYVLYAALKGEVLPGADRTSLLSGVLYQLQGRASSGSIFTPGTLGNRTAGIWLQLDTVLPAAALIATPLAFAVRRLRPIAAAHLILLLMLVRPGYLPVPFIIAMLPLGALLVAGVVASAWEHRPARGARLLGVLGVAGALAVVAVAAPAWGAQLRGFTRADLDAPMTQATAWIGQNVPRQDRILTDDSLWVDLVKQGRDREDVVWFYKPDTDPAVARGWQNYQWVVSTSSVRSDPSNLPTVTGALRASRAVAIFGTGISRVEVRQVRHGGPAPQRTSAQRTRDAGRQLVADPRLDLSDPARAALLSATVDGRLLGLLALAAGTHDLAVQALPQPAAERAAGAALRRVQISAVDGSPVTAAAPQVRDLLALMAAQDAQYRPVATLTGAGRDGTLTLTVPFAAS